MPRSIPQLLERRSETEVSDAIHNCAKQCLKDDMDVRQQIDSCCDRLRSKGWNKNEIEQFKLGILHVLAHLRKDNSLLPTD